jgi:hypothetical protein
MPNRRPHAFGGVAVHLTNPITVIIARPLLLPMTNGRMRAEDMIVPCD